MSDERHECGHTDAEHGEMPDVDLEHLLAHVQVMPNPRVAVILTEEGHLHYATTLNPHEAAALLSEVTEKIRRSGQQYVSMHWDRGRAAQWN